MMKTTGAFWIVCAAVAALLNWCDASDDREWVVGYQKVGTNCMPVGGLTQPGHLPFPYASMEECKKSKVAGNFDEAAKRWKGYVLDNGKCLKVWARSSLNPFTLVKLSDCEKERSTMKIVLAALEASTRTRRALSEEEALKIGKSAVDLVITGLAVTVNPAFNLLKPLVSLLWPSAKKPSVWDQVRSKVKALINQKMNEAYADDLQNFLDSMKKEMETYNGYADSSSQKVPKIISIDTSLGVREGKFMNKKDQVSTLTYYVPYVTTRLMVKLEAMRVAKVEEKQPHVKEFLVLCKRHIPFLGRMAYGGFEQWRRSHIKCTKKKEQKFQYFETWFEWNDGVTGVNKKEKKGQNDDLPAWCRQYTDPVMKEASDFVLTLRENVRSWATIFNNMAMNPWTKGFTASESQITTDGKKCKIPFTYKTKNYTKCTADGDTKPWCYKEEGGWGYCFSVAKMNIDLTSCKMPTNLNEQYFGHKSVTEAGKACLPWAEYGTFTDFPMDGQSRVVASNHCRRLEKTDKRPWCYTPASWGYCSIRDCDSDDWA